MDEKDKNAVKQQIQEVREMLEKIRNGHTTGVSETERAAKALDEAVTLALTEGKKAVEEGFQEISIPMVATTELEKRVERLENMMLTASKQLMAIKNVLNAIPKEMNEIRDLVAPRCKSCKCIIKNSEVVEEKP